MTGKVLEGIGIGLFRFSDFPSEAGLHHVGLVEGANIFGIEGEIISYKFQDSLKFDGGDNIYYRSDRPTFRHQGLDWLEMFREVDHE